MVFLVGLDPKLYSEVGASGDTPKERFPHAHTRVHKRTVSRSTYTPYAAVPLDTAQQLLSPIRALFPDIKPERTS